MELRKALQLNPMLRWVGALIAGIVAADGLAHCVSANCWQWLLAGTVGVLLATYLLHEERRVWPQCLLLVAATFLLGATLQGRAQERLSVMVPNEAVEYEAVVSSEPQAKGKTARMDLLVTRVGNRPLPRPSASGPRSCATRRPHVGNRCMWAVEYVPTPGLNACDRWAIEVVSIISDGRKCMAIRPKPLFIIATGSPPWSVFARSASCNAPV